MNTELMFSSQSDEWETPQWLYDDLDLEFGFDFDVCATKENAKHIDYYDKEDDALSRPWYCAGNGRYPATCWMNPPHGRTISRWMKKAYEESQLGATVVCLIPARTDTKWWHEYALKGEIRFLRGRLKFGGHKNSAPFPSAIVIFRPMEKLTNA